MMLIDGIPSDHVPADDRGLAYGDGVFRTLRVTSGKPRFWHRHHQKLLHDCSRLGIVPPQERELLADVRRVSAGSPDCAVRITITRGSGGRGYALPASPVARRLVSASSLPDMPADWASKGIRLRYCSLRLSAQPVLAGIKHLNRLENVLARAEWNDPGIAEGLLCDRNDHVIEGTRSNLFLVEQGRLVTPCLDDCGVSGVTRELVIELSASRGLACAVEPVSRVRLERADEIFLVNSLIGLLPAAGLEARQWSVFPVATRIRGWIDALADSAD